MKLVDNKIQFDEDDMFDFDAVLSDIIHDGLVKFKNAPRNSIPPDFFKNTRLILSSDEIDAGIMWEQVIDEMIFAFSNIDLTEEYDKIVESPYDFSQECFTKDNVFKPAIKPGFTSQQIEEWHKSRDEWKKSMNNRIKYGRQLFAKYFDNLWI